MNHFLYVMAGEDKAPAGSLSTNEWFYMYKWKKEGETFVPISTSSEDIALTAEKGDLLWFSFRPRIQTPPHGTLVFGRALIVRADPYPLNNNYPVEIWFEGESCEDVSVAIKSSYPYGLTKLDSDWGEKELVSLNA